MKIIADNNIPFLNGIAESFGDVKYLAGAEFTKDNIKDADTLIVRTVTRFDKQNLEGSNVKLICSATIGYDHIDTDYCDRHGIEWHNAPGCNSGSVQQYVASVLITIARKKGFSLKGKTIGIIGVGNVGKKVAFICELLGMRVLKNDPPREKMEGSNEFVPVDLIKKEADIITFHTPLSKDGEFPTYHLADKSFFKSLEKNPVIINSARGGIVNTEAIKEAIDNKLISGSIIDCWEKEPDIDLEYMDRVDIATPHIAGYSADGKANASRMSLDTLARFWSLDKSPIERIVVPEVANPVIDYNEYIGDNPVENIILQTYNPLRDFDFFYQNPTKFSYLRGHYPLRREYPGYIIENIPDTKTEDIHILKSIGFHIDQ